MKDCNALGCITMMVGSYIFQIHCNQTKTQKYTCKIDHQAQWCLNIALSEHCYKSASQGTTCWESKSVTRWMQETVSVHGKQHDWGALM